VCCILRRICVETAASFRLAKPALARIRSRPCVSPSGYGPPWLADAAAGLDADGHRRPACSAEALDQLLEGGTPEGMRAALMGLAWAHRPRLPLVECTIAPPDTLIANLIGMLRAALLPGLTASQLGSTQRAERPSRLRVAGAGGPAIVARSGRWRSRGPCAWDEVGFAGNCTRERTAIPNSCYDRGGGGGGGGGRPGVPPPNQVRPLAAHGEGAYSRRRPGSWLVSAQPQPRRGPWLEESTTAITRFGAQLQRIIPAIERPDRPETRPVALKIQGQAPSLMGLQLPAWKLGAAPTADREFFGAAEPGGPTATCGGGGKGGKPHRRSRKMQPANFVWQRNHGHRPLLKARKSGDQRRIPATNAGGAIRPDGTLRVGGRPASAASVRYRASHATPPPDLNRMAGWLWSRAKERALKTVRRWRSISVKL